MQEAEKPKILVVKDSGLLCKSLNTAIERGDFECTRTNGEEEGLAAAESTFPDLIILDMERPRARGISILLKLREIGSVKDTPIIIISIYGNRQDKLVSYANGANRFFIRPVNPDTLLKDIKTLLRINGS